MRSVADDRRLLRWSRRAAVRAAGAARAHAAGPVSRDAVTGRLSGGYSSVPFARQCSCGTAKGDVGVAWSSRADAAYPATGVVTCGSVWACAVCAAKIRRRRTIEVEGVAAWHAANGGKLVMLTLTLRHTRGDSLSTLVGGLCAAWRVVQQGRSWCDRRKGLVGMVRALEVTQSFTFGKGGGWHPHLHVLLLVPVGVDADALAGEVADELETSWPVAVVAELGEKFRPLRSIGVDVRVIGTDSAKYVTKISAEVTRSDLKGRDRSVWSLIDECYWSRFAEYAGSMKGRRAVQFSRGLREAAGLVVPVDDSDESLLLVDFDEGVIVAVFDRRQWNRFMRGDSSMACAVLEGLAVRCRLVRRAPAQPVPLLSG